MDDFTYEKIMDQTFAAIRNMIAKKIKDVRSGKIPVHLKTTPERLIRTLLEMGRIIKDIQLDRAAIYEVVKNATNN